MAAQADGPRSVDDLLEALGAYGVARTVILDALGIPSSNRDPLAEFSERFVAALLGGALAPNRVQAGYDITLTDGRTVQVKYLANPGGPWVNEHHIRSLAGVDHYAVVIYEAFELKAVLVFPADLTAVCARLGKRHPRHGSRERPPVKDPAEREDPSGSSISAPVSRPRASHRDAQSANGDDALDTGVPMRAREVGVVARPQRLRMLT